MYKFPVAIFLSLILCSTTFVVAPDTSSKLQGGRKSHGDMMRRAKKQNRSPERPSLDVFQMPMLSKIAEGNIPREAAHLCEVGGVVMSCMGARTAKHVGRGLQKMGKVLQKVGAVQELHMKEFNTAAGLSYVKPEEKNFFGLQRYPSYRNRLLHSPPLQDPTQDSLKDTVKRLGIKAIDVSKNSS